MEQKQELRLQFRFGIIGKLIPAIVGVGLTLYAALNQSNMPGYMFAFVMTVMSFVLVVKNQADFGKAVVRGLTKPMFAVIVLSIILANVSGKLIQGSGLVQTLAASMLKIGFTGKLFCVGTFLLCCLLAFSTGTSVGTYLVVMPVLFPVGVVVGVDPLFMVGAVVSGAAFGDNLGPISDNAIATSQTQEADLGYLVKSRCKYVIPAGILALIGFLIFTKTVAPGVEIGVEGAAEVVAKPLSLLMLAIPAVIITLCLMRKHLITAMVCGNLVGIVVGLISGLYKFSDIISFEMVGTSMNVGGKVVEGVNGAMGTAALLIFVFALLGLLEASGMFEVARRFVEKSAKTPRRAEAAIALSVGIVDLIVGVISIGIVALGAIINDVGERAGVNRYRRANIMGCTGLAVCFLSPWTIHCVMPAALAMQYGATRLITPANVPFVNFYALAMLGVLIFSIVTGYARNNKSIPNDAVKSDY